MTTKIRIPAYLSDNSISQYELEVEAWQLITQVAKNKRALTLVLNLPCDRMRNQVLEAVGTAELGKDEGVATYLKYMKDNYGRYELYESVDRYIEFRNCVRSPGQTLSEFLMVFDQCVTRIEKKGMKLPSDVLAFELIHKANVTKDENKLIMTGLDFTKKTEMYGQAKNAIKKLLGEIGSGGHNSGTTLAIKVEPTQLVNKYVNSGCDSDATVNTVNYNGFNRFKNGSSEGRAKFGGAYNGADKQNWCGGYKNPRGRDGKILQCYICGSKEHLVNKCPNRWQETSDGGKSDSGEYESMVNEVHFSKGKISDLCTEASGCAVLDTACPNTVTSKKWMYDYMNNHLSNADRKKVVKTQGVKHFKFGGGPVIVSEAEMKIPAVVAGKKVMISTSVVDTNVPLLLSVQALSKAGAVLDTKDKSATLWGVKAYCKESRTGHWLLNLTASYGSDGVTCAVTNHIDSVTCAVTKPTSVDMCDSDGESRAL